MLKSFIVFIILSFSLLHAKEYSDSCLKETKALPEFEYIIDVQTKEEFAHGHPKGAINIPYEMEVNGETVINDGYDKEMVLIRRIGLRSVKAAILLANEGHGKLTNIQQGFVNGWEKTGLPIEKGSK